ncbi:MULTISPECIES: hypothetical protein [unclassified Sphingomonas]|uniref:hypothetical protein n=1 Tax=unclassified Sphingomonas TaxID=196159 RepID=UPI00226AA30F|nr:MULTISPECIES: hypothetical protein [unclassified Sphingomonas]
MTDRPTPHDGSPSPKRLPRPAIAGLALAGVAAVLWARWAAREPALDARTRQRLRG